MVLVVFFMSNLMKIINIWMFSNRILQTWTGHNWYLIISCLDPKKASGTDDINHRMVIASENTICRPLCKLFNLSLRKICFPSFRKPANVTAVFKKSDKSITSYYRPISLFSCVSRKFERTWLILSVYINMSFDFPFVRLFGVR